MTTPPHAQLTRAVAAGRLGWGCALAATPRLLLGAGTTSRPATAIVRVLAAREVVQGAATVALPQPGVAMAGAAVDWLHAISMLALAAAVPTHRGPALRSAAVTTGLAIATLLAARFHGMHPAGSSYG